MTIYVLTFKSTASHDAEKRAGLNLFLKTMGRKYRLKCLNIEEKEVTDPPRRASKAVRPPSAGKQCGTNGSLDKTLARIFE